MATSSISVKLTKHAEIKIAQRSITLDDIRKVVIHPELIEPDKLDVSLVHFISNMGGRFLRVIGRWENKNVLLVVNAFFDRRLKKEGRIDVKNQL